MKKLIALILAISLCLSFAACGGDNAAVSSDQYPQLAGKEIVQAAEFHYTLDYGCRETFNLIFFVTDAYNPDMGSAGIYMLDTDSGKLYDDSFLDWSIMVQGDGWNMDTRDTALMVLFNSYDCNKDGDILWSEVETFTHYSSSQIAELSSRLSGGSAASPKNEQQANPSVDNEAAAQPSIDPEFVYEQAKLLHTQLHQVVEYHYTLEEGCQETLNLLFFEIEEFADLDPRDAMFSGSGIYMMDMDTGIWYDGTIIDIDNMTAGGTWNFSTKESALMCFMDFFSMNRKSDMLWSEDEEFIRLGAEDLAAVNQKLLIDELTRTKVPYPYESIDEEPRQLSDEELAELVHRPAGYMKSKINTVPDAIAYLDMQFPDLWMGYTIDNGIETNVRWHRSAVEILSSRDTQASRGCVVNCINYLLSDNYEIDSLIAFWPDPDVLNEDGPQKAINAIKTTDGYLFFDPVLRMQGDSISRKGSLLPELKCSSIAEYVENIRQTPALADIIKYIFKNADGGRMDFTRSFSMGYTITTSSPGIEIVYYNVPAKEPGQYIKPENIGSYKISTMLGGVTLTAEEAYALVDAAPEVVQAKVKTAADVLMYMLAARIGDTHGCLCTDVGNYIWHWNISAKEVMSMGLGNCGSCANLANYLLDGDYEEVGFMDQAYYPGNGGSHVYTYILHEGKYYIVDYSWFIFSNYEPTQDYAITVLNSLNQWPEKIQWIYGPVCLVMTYDTPGMQYPVIFGDDYEQELGGVYYVLPEGAEYTVLYEAPDGYQYHHIPFDTSAYNWNVFW